MIVVVALILAVLAGVLILIPRNQKSGNVKRSAQQAAEKSLSEARKSPRAYSKAEVALHNQRTDCWIIIKDKVYDVTSYVEEHPGGDAILRHAGGDSTEGFYGPQHGFRVFEVIDDFCIGDLEQ